MRSWLRNARQNQGLTMADMGGILGISESYYCAIENGTRQGKMDIALAVRLSEALNVPMETILTNENE